MGTIRVLFCLLCGFVIGCGRGDSGSDVGPGGRAVATKVGVPEPSSGQAVRTVLPRDEWARDRIVRIAKAEVGVKELGNNDGKRVRAYLSYTGINTPAPWCAAFASFCFKEAGFEQPRSAWSPSLFPAGRIVKEPKPADVFGIYIKSLRRIGHCGILIEMRNDWARVVEGNTSVDGSREGQGVFERVRHRRTISGFADWVR